jgi:hypothetical protein
VHFFSKVQIRIGARLTCTASTESSLAGVKGEGREADCSPALSFKVKNGGTILVHPVPSVGPN